MRTLHYVIILLLFSTGNAFGLDDPTAKKPLLPWIWEDQFKPTLIRSIDQTSLVIAASGTTSVIAVHHWDRKIERDNKEHHLVFSEKEAEQLGKIGNGLLYIGIAATQFVFDQDNGLSTGRALILTSLSHLTLGSFIRRNRPGNRDGGLPYPSSCPSGHTSMAFATAGSLAYSYGWKVGVPAYVAATAVGISRIRIERHWASDVVAGAFLGTFWARASFAGKEDQEKAMSIVPTPVEDGYMLTASWKF